MGKINEIDARWGDAEDCYGDIICEQAKADVQVLLARIIEALGVAKYGSTDGAHHKMWVIDQMVRALTGEDYNQWVVAFEVGEEGRRTHTWEQGVAP